MIRGLYTAASGMITRQMEQENLSNNIANINTPGYKKNDIAVKSFDKVLIESRDKLVGNSVFKDKLGYMELGVGVDDTRTFFTQGVISDTGRNLDFAINGDGQGLEFFNVQDDKGVVKYTRAGSFKINSDGELVTPEGYKVLSENGNPIKVNTTDIKLTSDGTIQGSVGNVKFGISKFNPQDLKKDEVAFNCYTGTNPSTYTSASVKQGSLEKSNVDPIETMTQMISVMRSYESNQKVIQQIDSTLDKTVNEVGSVR